MGIDIQGPSQSMTDTSLQSSWLHRKGISRMWGSASTDGQTLWSQLSSGGKGVGEGEEEAKQKQEGRREGENFE